MNKKKIEFAQDNKDLWKENNLLHKMKLLNDALEIEKTKNNILEQHGRQEMLEVTGIRHEDGKKCNDIYRIFKLTLTNIKNQKLKFPTEWKTKLLLQNSKIDQSFILE